VKRSGTVQRQLCDAWGKDQRLTDEDCCTLNRKNIFCEKRNKKTISAKAEIAQTNLLMREAAPEKTSRSADRGQSSTSPLFSGTASHERRCETE